MATPQQDQATATVLQALQASYHDPDSNAKKRANEWLEEFQHSTEAWQTCHTILVSPDAPLEGRSFSAQTSRSKILYDLPQLPRDASPSLRDSLLNALGPLALPTAPAGSKAVLTQLCSALADLASQMPEWTNVVQGMIEQFGKEPGTVVVSLRFSGSSAEESLNTRLPRSPEGTDNYDESVSGSAEAVINVLSMYIQAEGLTTQIQSSIFETMRSWLRAGEFPTSAVAQSPLYPAMFAALESDQSFDAAVDVICDLIHETQEIHDNMPSVQEIIPRLIALGPKSEQYHDDADRIRGYCRMFCEAGECYQDIIKSHPRESSPLVEAISKCTAYEDSDIVPITFQFWWILSGMVDKSSDETWGPYYEIFAKLQTIIIGHSHFPGDNEQQTAQERDEFRSFRHRMGDTSKDCCKVLGAPTCLRRSYDMVVEAMAKPNPSWQEIEAPSFSMRSMGAEVDPDDDEVVPHIMEMSPKLPDHPRIRYAAILVISRYTQWIDRHPQNLEFQSQYISAGFDMADDEVSAAAAQAMKFMCQDCNQHLVPYLPQSHQFVTTVADKSDQADISEVCEAIAYVVSSSPSTEAAQALQQFTQPLIEKVQTVANAPGEASKQDSQKTADTSEQSDAYLQVVRTSDPVPESCYPTAATSYSVFDALLARYAKLYYISERVGSILRRGSAFFPVAASQPVVQPVLDRMASSFAETGYASYIWITGKVAQKFGDVVRSPGNEALAALLIAAFENVTASSTKLLQVKDAAIIADVMDDYVHCFMAYSASMPQQTLASPASSQAVSHTSAASQCPAPETVLVCLDTSAMSAQDMNQPQYAASVQPVFAQFAKPIFTQMSSGVVSGFREDGIEQVPVIFQAVLSSVPPAESTQYAGEASNSIPGHNSPQQEKAKYSEESNGYSAQGSPSSEKVKQITVNSSRAARRARERARQSRKSLGGV